MEKFQSLIDFEHQAFESLPLNPYEIVIALSKNAREINDKAQKYLGPGVQVNPVTLSLNRIHRQATFVYDNDEHTPPENGKK